MTKVLLVGSNSRIGRYLRSNAPASLFMDGAGRTKDCNIYLDLLNADTFAGISESYDCAIVLAGLTNIREVEKSAELAHVLNYKNTVLLVEHLNSLNTPCLFLSSSAVFANDAPTRCEHAPRRPDTLYGLLKSKVEDQLLRLHPSNSILRLTKVVDDSFIVHAWLDNLRKSIPVTAFRDLCVAPIHIKHVADAIYRWCETGCGDVFHISCDQQISYYDWIVDLTMRLGLRKELIASASIASLGEQLIFHPNDARLDCFEMHSLKVGLDEINALIASAYNNRSLWLR